VTCSSGQATAVGFVALRALDAFPLGTVLEGAGLNVTVMSYMGNVDIGFMACRELVPDVRAVSPRGTSTDGALTLARKATRRQVGHSPPYLYVMTGS
jgi:diacylglycerol O-acyltransferase / wax synthase